LRRFSWGQSRFRHRLLLFTLIAVAVAVLPSGCGVVRHIIQTEVSLLEASEALEAALAQLGVPYKFGGQTPDEGFDCSGLIVWAYKQVVPNVRLRIGDGTYEDGSMEDLFHWNVTLVAPQDLAPGDIVFLADQSRRIVHGGLFIEETEKGFRFVNASSYWGRVVIDEWSWDGEKRGQQFAGAGRLRIVRQ